MPGRRMIHTSIWHSRQVCQLKDKARLLYIGLITIADDEGRFNADCELIKANVFPRDRISPKKISELLKTIEATKLICLYLEKNELFGFHPNWSSYQTLRKDRLTKSNIPPPVSTNRQPNDNHVPTQDKVSEDNKREVSIDVLHTNTGTRPGKTILDAYREHLPNQAARLSEKFGITP